MALNLDQTPLKYAPCSRHTLEKKNAKYVAMAGTLYRKAITGNVFLSNWSMVGKRPKIHQDSNFLMIFL